MLDDNFISIPKKTLEDFLELVKRTYMYYRDFKPTQTSAFLGEDGINIPIITTICPEYDTTLASDLEKYTKLFKDIIRQE